jgi:hypothetical protein
MSRRATVQTDRTLGFTILALVTAGLLSLAGCAKYRNDPCRLLPPGSCAKPTPSPTATPTSELTTPTPTAAPTSAPTSTPTPVPTSAPSSCAAVETLNHDMAPGQSCHAWHEENGTIRCLVDSTIRPICDEAHADNWFGICGEQSHDADFRFAKNAFQWTLDGATDLGPAPNAAQRWIRGAPGAQVMVRVCIPEGAVTARGCVIKRASNPCGTRTFFLPMLGAMRVGAR